MHRRCICVSLLDVVNEFLFKNVTKSLKGHLSASFIKDKKVQSNIKKSVLGYLCHSHWAHVLSPSFLLIIPSWAPVIHLVPGGIGHSSLSLNAGSINCDSFNMSVLHPDFWDFVPYRRKGITNPWLKSPSKAQHCLLKRKKILENVFLKPWTYLQVCLSLFWIGEVTTASLHSRLLPCQSVEGFLQSTCITLFSFLFYFGFPAEQLLNSSPCFLIFFSEQCLSQIHVALCWRQSRGLLNSAASLALLHPCLNICI